MPDLERPMNNIITRTDSYKYSHWLQYPPGTRTVYDYVESRGGEFSDSLFFGLQMYLPKLSEGFTQHDIDEAEEDVQLHGLPFNRAGWEHILNKHGGIPPVRIKAIPEGTLLPVKNVLVTIENTDPACYWLPGHLETSLLRGVWYPTTVATNSFHAKTTILKARLKSCDDPFATLPYALHDFSARGVSSGETAEIGGAAHLVNFAGTDTFECLRMVRRIYGERMAGHSVPAAEHSTITCWRRGDITREVDAYDAMLTNFAAKEGSIVAVVSDSYDLWHAIQHIWGGSLWKKVRESGCCVVIRPDSGDPATVPVKAIEMLAERFGFTVNSKGYRVLPPCVRVIQGDGLDRHMIGVILYNLLLAGFAAENLVFGMGGALAQMMNRDTMQWAMKSSAQEDSEGVWWDVFKSPVDQPTKRSKSGRFAVINGTDGYRTVPLAGNEHRDELRTVWENGHATNDTFAAIRSRAHDAALLMAA